MGGADLSGNTFKMSLETKNTPSRLTTGQLLETVLYSGVPGVQYVQAICAITEIV